jgi:hypothetical protein
MNPVFRSHGGSDFCKELMQLNADKEVMFLHGGTSVFFRYHELA